MTFGSYTNIFLGVPSARTFSVKFEYFFWRWSGYPLPIFFVAFAPQSHKKGFPLLSFTQTFAIIEKIEYYRNYLLKKVHLSSIKE